MKSKLTLLICFLFTILIVGLSPFLGLKIYSLSSILSAAVDSTESLIFWKLRAPRTILAFLVGASLAISGLVFQAIFKNPLASPYTLGVASGASFGATFAISISFYSTFFLIDSVLLFALSGALITICFVYYFASKCRSLSSNTMLLAGVAINFFFSSLVLFIQYLSDFTQSFRIIRWLMGELGAIGFESVFNLLPYSLLSLCILLYLNKELDIISLGYDLAESKGVSVDRTHKKLFLVTSLLVGAVVATCGPIAFVGIIVPHVARMIIGNRHKELIIFSYFTGGAFLVLCDTFARVVIAPAEIPVGVITSLLGGPFFLFLLFYGKNR